MIRPIVQFFKTRKIHLSPKRSGGHDEHHDMGGIPGKNLPFKLRGPAAFSIVCMLYFGPPLWAPMLITLYQLSKA